MPDRKLSIYPQYPPSGLVTINDSMLINHLSGIASTLNTIINEVNELHELIKDLQEQIDELAEA